MDTKSIKSKYDLKYKIIAWVLCIFSMCFITFSGVRIARYDSGNEITSDKYAQSMAYKSAMDDYTNSVNKAFFGYNEDGETTELNTYISSLKNSYEEELRQVLMSTELEGNYEAYMEKFKSEFSKKVAGVEENAAAAPSAEVAGEGQGESDRVTVQNQAETFSESGSAAAVSGEETNELPALDEYTQRQVDSVNEKYAKLLNAAPEYIGKQYEEKKQTEQDSLTGNRNYYFAIVENGKVTHTNVEQSNPVEWIGSLESNKQFSWNGAEPGLFEALPEQQDSAYMTSEYELPSTNNARVYVGMSNDFFTQSKVDYAQTYKAYLLTVVFMVICTVVFAGAFLWLIYTAGRSARSNEVKVGPMDAIYLDVGGVGLLGIELILAVLFASERVTDSWSVVQAVRIAIYVSIGTVLLILWSMSVSRRVKRRENYTLVARIFNGFKTAYDRSGMKARGVGMVVGCLLAGLGFLGLTVLFGALMGPTGVFVGLLILAIYVTAILKHILLKAAAVREISKAVECIKDGTLDYRIPKGGGQEFDEIAYGIEHIAEGFETAVTKEVKAEKMKTELITNVSHDIKTPLTSILTYVDLLKKEGLSSPNAMKYLNVLDMKSKRLKFLTDDLFEAAKASSGDMNVDMSHMELVQFMEQALGEMSDKIESSGLEFVMNAPQGEVSVEADGKLLWRVIGNVIDNAIKYTAPGTRVYIDFMQTDETNCIIVKNVSRDPLNMTEDELMERFKRGDESRNTEGSGLGLSIAQNFMQLMNGTFRIEIDGDLFKVVICFPREAQGMSPEEEIK